MKQRIPLLALVGALALVGCRADLTGLQVASVEDLASWQRARANLVVCDANNDKTRERFGVIPGAVLLSSYHDYDPASELPADKAKTLVFYCSTVRCGAGAEAARKAVAAGYRDVWVMEPGIKGWAEAGQPVEPFASAGTAS